MSIGEGGEKHPSYGTIVFNRCFSNGTTLFGSNIKHNNYITLEIKHASMGRELHSDWVSDAAPICRVGMSYAQFAEAISSFGSHPGVPVTIEFTEKDGYVEDRPEFKNKRIELDEELKQQMEEVTRTVAEASTSIGEILNKKGNVTKADKQEIMSILYKMQNMMPNTEFIHKRMAEEMEKVVLEAKNEIEAYTQHKMDVIAAKAMSQQVLDDNMKAENLIPEKPVITMD